MPAILSLLILLDALAFGSSIFLGIGLDTAASVRFHLLTGVLTAILFVFTHSLVLFYLIGTGVDIREAVADDEALAARYVPLTRELKRRSFPWACASIALIILAALLGAEVHSRLIPGPGDPVDALPLRGVGGWWIHLALVVLAAAVNARAFVVELATVRANRRAIGEINAALASTDAPATASLEG